MSVNVSLSEKVISGLKNIQENYHEIVDHIYMIEAYITSVENNEVPPIDTLNALRALKKLDKFITPLEM